ncbi:MAG: hypothetical protein M1834_004838 [Cirrosporium novae-zelandiae]|nr:MAG: hypothetical protein M1834_004838 [Cirrosporium novae-zelandiae]
MATMEEKPNVTADAPVSEKESAPEIKEVISAAPAEPKTNGQTTAPKPPAPKPAKEPSPKDSAPGEKVLSNAEKKKLAKEEKAKRREKAKAEKATVPQISAQHPTTAAKKTGAKDSEHAPKGGKGTSGQNQGSKGLHKRTGSQAVEPAKGIPIRIGSVQVALGEESKKVALFGHLYGHPRRTNLVGAGKDVHPAVLALGLQMSNYVICGSNARCVATLLAFKRVIESYTTPPGHSLNRHLVSHLSPQIEYLVSCRPMAISMGNAIRWLKLEINKVDVDTPESKAKADLCEAIDFFIRERITLADQVIAEKSVEKIVDGDVILTFAKSSIVQSTIIEAHKRGKNFRVIVTDSRPLFEGRNLARSLSNLGIEVQYSLIHGISHAVKDATKVFLGAHAMMSNGRLYSRAGTAIVAMMACEADVPVIVCCESIKFTERVALDSIVLNEVAPPDELVSIPPPEIQTIARPADAPKASPLEKWQDIPNLQLLNLMYDVTPAEYIKMVVCEHGSLPPSSVPVVQRFTTNMEGIS